MPAVSFSATLSTTQLDAALQRANQSVGQWATNVQNQTSGIDASLNKIGATIAVYFSAQKLMEFGRAVIDVRGEFQQLGIAFETMLGSKGKADKLMNEAIQFAQKTPFTLRDVAGNIKQLMAMGIATDDVMATMKSLGDVAAGVSVPISRVAINYGQVATMGKLQGRELRDFAMAGIPLVDELAKNFGKAKSEIQDMVTAGQVGFKDVEKAFQTMSGEGGKFYNLMEKQNASVTGQISNLTDKWDVMLNEIGKSNEGLIYSGISGLSTLITNYKVVGDVFGGLIVTLGAYKLAVMLVAREQVLMAAATEIAASSNGVLTASEARLWAVQERRLATQAALNKSMLLNPWVIGATLVAAFGYALYKVLTYESELEKATKKANVEIDIEQDKVANLFAQLKNAKEGTEGWKKAKDGIISQYGQYLTGQEKELSNTQQIAEAYDKVTKGIQESISARIRDEQLKAVSSDIDPAINKAKEKLLKEVSKTSGRQAAADARQQLGLIDLIKYEIDPVKKGQLMAQFKKFGEDLEKTAAVKGFSLIGWEMVQINNGLTEYQKRTEEINKAFGVQAKQIESQTVKQVTFTTLASEIDELKERKKKAEAELHDLETKPFEIKDKSLMESIKDKKAQIKELDDLLGTKAEEKAVKATGLDDRISAVKALMDVTKDANSAEFAALAKKLTVLELEKKLREDLIEQQKIVAKNNIIESKGAQSAISAIYDMAASRGINLGDLKIKNTDVEVDKLKRGNEERERQANELRRKYHIKEKEDARDLQQEFYAVANAANQIGNALGEGAEKAKQLIGAVGNIAGVLGDAAKKGFKDMDFSSALGIGITLMTTIAELINSAGTLQSRHLATIERMNVALEKQARIIQDSARFGGQQGAQSADIKLLEAKKKEIERYRDEFIASYKWVLGDAAITVGYGMVKKEWDEVTQAIKDANQALTDFNAGGITENTLADSIAKAFQDGKGSVKDFADYTNDILREAVLTAFKANILGKTLTDAQKQISVSFSDGTLTAKEIADIRESMKAATDGAKATWDSLTTAFPEMFKPDTTTTTDNGLSGSTIARAITEDTGSEISGLLRRSADDTRQIRDITKMGINNLIGIEANTMETVVQLKRAVVELQSIVSNTKTTFSGKL